MSVLFQKPMMNPPFKLEDWNECTLPKNNDESFPLNQRIGMSVLFQKTMMNPPFKLEDWNECTLPNNQ